jgi:chromosome segregation ATPase
LDQTAIASNDLENRLINLLSSRLQPLCEEVALLNHRMAQLEASTRALNEAIESDRELLKQQIDPLEQTIQLLNETLQPLPSTLMNLLSQFLRQLQTTLNSKNSSDARVTLQQQLKQLISALSAWSRQLKTEIDGQKRLIDSMQQLEEKLNGLRLGGEGDRDLQ